MAANKKRVPVKWIRDKAKSAYQKDTKCKICNSTEALELHHTNSITLLLEKWAKENGFPLNNDEQILAVRDRFIAEHKVELYDNVVTLCNPHHVKLHSVFGKAPPLATLTKQMEWIQNQKDINDGKYSNEVLLEPSGETEPSSTYNKPGARFSSWY